MNYILPNMKINETDFCVVDVETTGLSARNNRIIEIGIVRVANLKIFDQFHTLLNPGRQIPFYITQFTGITNDDVYDAPYFEDIAQEIEDFLSGSVIAAHNLPFDMSFMRREFSALGKQIPNEYSLCTLKLARKMFPALRSKSLSSVCRHLNLRSAGEHRALSDAKVTARALIKMIKQLQNANGIEFIDQLLSYQSMPRETPLRVKLNKKLEEDFAALPDAPGIYSFLNSKNEIIYIGKAKSLKSRIKSYLSPAASGKTKKIVKQASRMKIEITNTELTALLAEAQSIKLIQPKHNTQLKGYGSKYFLRINTTEEFPSIQISNSFDFDGNDYFGLFGTKKKADALLQLIHKTFMLRECDNNELKKGRACFLAEIERCTAPCVNQDKQPYYDELEKLYEFMFGKNQFAVTRLLNKMKVYSSQLKFEKASEIKDLLDMILAQTFKSSILREPVNSANVLFEITEGVNKDFVLLMSGKIYIKKYAIDEKDTFESALEDYFDGTINVNSLPDEEDLEKMKIILNWLMKNRQKTRACYLKDYSTKQELFSNIQNYTFDDKAQLISTFDIKDFISVIS